MSSSNCCFLTCIQISQETGQVVWYSHLFKNFPQYVVIHTVKGFGVVNKAEVNVSLELLLFRWSNGCWQFDLWFLLPFLNPAWTSESSQFMYYLKPGLENFEHYFTSMWDEFNCEVVWAFFGIGMKTDLFQSCGHCWGFQICWHIECRTFRASSFKIWNSSTGIPLTLSLH